MQALNKLSPMETAPRDKPILLDVGYPWLVMAIWNEPEQCWVYANLALDFDGGKQNYSYWENEFEKEITKKGLIGVFGWLPVPTVIDLEVDKQREKILKLNSKSRGLVE